MLIPSENITAATETHSPTVKEHSVTVRGIGEFSLREDHTLLDGLQSANMEVTAACGGRGKCGKCLVTIIEGTVDEVSSDGVGRECHVSPELPRDVLSCRTTPLTDLTIELKKKGAGKIEGLGQIEKVEIDPLLRKIALTLPHESKDIDATVLSESLGSKAHIQPLIQEQLCAIRSQREEFTVTVAELPEGSEIIKVELGCTVKNLRGIAVDIGTTTVACAMFDLTSGELVGESSMYNKQMSMGADVISRISHSQEEDGLRQLQEAVVETINGLIADVATKTGIDESKVDCIVVSGNTTMLHLLHGLDPHGIGQAPFTPVTNEIQPIKAKSLGIHICPEGYVYSTPSISAYIGGDITSDLLASRILDEAKTSLLIDFGTNGEMVLTGKGRVLTASCAMGPAFEGASIGCGMNGRAGAIEKYWIEPATGEPSFTVIGGGIPEGVCGSGLIDLLAELKRNGIVNEYGRFIDGASRYVQRDGEGRTEYMIAFGPHGPLTLKEKDVAALITAKAAMAAGFQICLKEMGLTTADLDRIIVAGGFGKHINLENAVEIGLLPEAPRNRFEIFGNGSLKGAVLELLNRHKYTETYDLTRRKAESIQLEQHPDFVDTFVDNMKIE